MRNHLLHCFTTDRMTSIPPKVNTKLRVMVYYTCRLPWVKANNSRGALIKCHVCLEWHHNARKLMKVCLTYQSHMTGTVLVVLQCRFMYLFKNQRVATLFMYYKFTSYTSCVV